MGIPAPPQTKRKWHSRVRRRTACKLDTQAGRFVTRKLSPDDARRTTFDDKGPEELLRLGAPSLEIEPDDYKWPYVVKHFGLQVLNAAGFINGQVPTEYASGFRPRGRMRTEHLDDPIHIHPVFRKDMWVNVENGDWDLLKPSLHLATALLDEPEVLRFFMAFFKKKQMVRSQSEGFRYARVDIPTSLTDRELGFIYGKMVEMRDHTTFEFVPQAQIDKQSGADAAVTHDLSLIKRVCVQSNTLSSIIWISQVYLDVLRQQADLEVYEASLNAQQYTHKVDPDRTIHIDGASSKLRTTLVLAICILHEFTHALALATIISDPKNILIQPYFPGDTRCEVGFAFEKYIFNGALAHMDCKELGPEVAGKYPLLCAQVPYGLTLQPRPTNWLVYATDNALEEMPVPAEYVSSLFSREFWDVKVQRWGASELRCPLNWAWAVRAVATSPAPEKPPWWKVSKKVSEFVGKVLSKKKLEGV